MGLGPFMVEVRPDVGARDFPAGTLELPSSRQPFPSWSEAHAPPGRNRAEGKKI